MPNSHPRPWHRGSEFGDGLRWPLDRERRTIWRARLNLARLAGRITALHVLVGEALLRRLGEDGRCDPSHETLAADAGCSERTVRRALAALGALGMVRWINRLVRTACRAEQTSNAYTLIVAVAERFLPRPRGKSACTASDGQLGREITSILIQKEPTQEWQTARAALARVRAEFAARWGRGEEAKFA